eukprot:2399339-Pyramimonas_sp.AAC.1
MGADVLGHGWLRRHEVPRSHEQGGARASPRGRPTSGPKMESKKVCMDADFELITSCSHHSQNVTGRIH